MLLQVFLWGFLRFMDIVFIPIHLVRFFRKSAVYPPIQDELLLIPALKLADLIRQKKVSCKTVIETYISRVKDVNPILNAVFEDRFTDAIADAAKIDVFLANTQLTIDEIKRQYPLLGVPITIKASIAVSGMCFNAGVVKHRDVKAQNDGVCVKYAREAGAIPILTSNVPELCLNWETRNKLIGTTSNPYNTTRTSGGSSGGEASLMGAAASLIGIGSDIAGSLRLPAHFCGIWGHKPSPNVISYVGHYPDCKSEDDWRKVFTLGPMARYACDLRFLLQVIAEPDMKGMLNLQERIDLGNVKFYYIKNLKSMLIDSINGNVDKAMNQVITHLDNIGKYGCVKIKMPLMKYSSELSFLKLLLIDDIENLFEGSGKGSYAELFRFLTCRSKCEFTSISYGLLRRNVGFIPKSAIKRTRRKLQELQDEFIKLLGIDGVLICPTYPREAHPHGDVIRKLFCPGYMSIFNSLGFPVTNCPISFTSEGLPVGIQVVAAPNCDRLTLEVAEELERAFGGWQPKNEINLN